MSSLALARDMLLGFTIALFSCVRHLGRPEATPEGCQAGDLPMCRALAAAAQDSPTGPALDRWACDQGYGPSCVILAQEEEGAAAARDLAIACDQGDAWACVAGAGLPDDGTTRGEVGRMALRACLLASDATGRRRTALAEACARADAMGWRSATVREVHIIRELYSPNAVLPGGTVLDINGGGLKLGMSKGIGRIPMQEEADHVNPGKVRGLTYTAEGRLLAVAKDPPLVWSLLDGVVTRLDLWPQDADDQHFQVALADDGSAVAATFRGQAGTAVWSLPEARLVGVAPRPAKGSFGLQVGHNGARLALIEKDTFRAAEPAQGLLSESRSGSSRAWLSDLALPASVGLRAAISPDGRLVAVPEAEAVRLLGPDGAALARIALPLIADHPVVHPLLWSSDGGQLLVPLHGSVAVITMSTATKTEADDAEILARILPPPLIPPAGSPALAMGGSVRGSVVVGAGGAAKAEVVAAPCVEGPPSHRTIAGADGSFSFSDLPRGCWAFTATGAGGLPADKVTASVGTETQVSLRLIATTRVSGVVLGKDGRPAAGATVRARLLDRRTPNGVSTREHIVTATATTDAAGRFTLDPAPVEGFQLEATLGGDAYVAKLAEPSKALNIQLKPAVIVRAELDPRGNYAQVVARVGEKEVKARLERDGSWISTDFAPGDVVTLSVLQIHTEGPAVTVTLPLSGAVALEGTPFGRLHVVSGGRYAAEIRIYGGINCNRTLDGCITQWLPEGPYPIYAHSSEGHRVGVTVAQLQPGEETIVPAPLDAATVEILGRVVDGRGRPVPGVELAVDCGDAGTRSSVRTGPDGRFRIPGVATAEVLKPFGVRPRVLHIDGAGWGASERPLMLPQDAAVLDLGDVEIGAGD